jgi:8-oxo-dGTP pyrophosphatase MutT (NUDIX family)/phosphohistidine phosphatase SixA
MPSERVIEAAGGVLWRPAVGGDGVEVALVHRPKYDDWSLPKGKLNPSEHVLLGALREVWEETGMLGVPGRPLGETRYSKDGEPKRVRYWAMRAGTGAFAPSEEVDQLMWLPPREGQQHLVPDRDRCVLVEFARDVEPTWACLLVRPGSAGERSAWPGDDRERPLDELGHAQAKALTSVLDAYQVQHVVSADVLRCLDTVGPYAELRQLPVESEPLMSESGTNTHPGQAVDQLLDIFARGAPVAVCSQGKAVPLLVDGLCALLSVRPPRDQQTRKSGFWAMHLAAGEPRPRLAALEVFEAPSDGRACSLDEGG